jgi:hypothetical protein
MTKISILRCSAPRQIKSFSALHLKDEIIAIFYKYHAALPL